MSAAPPLTALAAPRPQPPPRIVVMGEPGVGKTTLARDLGAVLLPLEAGYQYLDAPALVPPAGGGVIHTLDWFLHFCDRLLVEDHPWRAVAVDSLDALEKLVWAKTVAEGAALRGDIKNIEDFGFGKGFVRALAHWHAVLHALDRLRTEKNLLVLLLAHPRQRDARDQDLTEYTSWDLELHKTAAALVRGWADAVWFAGFRRAYREEKTALTEKTNFPVGARLNRELRLAPAPGAATKTRFPAPEKLPMPPGAAPVRQVLAAWLGEVAQQEEKKVEAE